MRVREPESASYKRLRLFEVPRLAVTGNRPAAWQNLHSTMDIDPLSDERDLAAVAFALLDGSLGELTTAERGLDPVYRPSAAVVGRWRASIRAGHDPFGWEFTRLRTPDERRSFGATYTPDDIVQSMIEWAKAGAIPDRIVDPGAGSGRFSLAAARAFPNARITAVEVDPLAALCLRANLSAAGFAHRSWVVVDDFRTMLPSSDLRTLWIGNPPYVRHHQIPASWKEWLTTTARNHGLQASQLAGLHVHFFLATLLQGRNGDRGCYITSSEWLDVNYGALVRDLLLGGLGGTALHVLEPTAIPFADAATTGTISCFEIGAKPTSMRVRRVEKVSDLKKLDGGRPVARDRLSDAPRWSLLLRPGKPVPAGHVELGELCRVHRGAVTGGNSVWVASASHPSLPDQALTPSVTRALELFAAGSTMASTEHLRRVVDLPANLDEFESEERRQVDIFLRWAKKHGADRSYIARHRRAWWSVGLRAPAPILATYMARRPPAFVRNIAGARHINIAHGLYPRQRMTDAQLDELAMSLRSAVQQSQGRTYAGGLTKFEPREMERIPVPAPATC